MELIQLVNTDPSVLTEHLLEFFAATPWLLPKSYAGLPYSNLTSRDLAVVAAARSKPKGSYSRAITCVFFSKGMVRMLQNAIYSMVKFGGVDNYIVVTWSNADLEACLDLNLPCADASAYLTALPTDTTPTTENNNTTKRTTSEDSSSSSNITPQKETPQPTQLVPEFETKAYNRIMWLKPAVVGYLLNQDYAVHSSDIDLSYAAKPVWDSYLMYLNLEPGAQAVDAAFQIEGDGRYGSPINSGNFVALPSQAMKHLFAAWLALSQEKVEQGGNQKGLQTLFNEEQFILCQTALECSIAIKKRELLVRLDLLNSTVPLPAIIRTFTPPWWSTTQDNCAISGETKLPVMDPCHAELFFLHPVCTPKGSDRVGLKTRVLDKAGFWFIDSKHGCPVDATELRNLAAYYKRVEEQENQIPRVKNLKLKLRLQRKARKLFNVELDDMKIVSNIPSTELSFQASCVPAIENGAASPKAEERNLEEKKKEDTGFDENEDLRIYSGRDVLGLERCIPLELKRPGNEARVADCPLRLAFV
jgi:hypothetical protein